MEIGFCADLEEGGFDWAVGIYAEVEKVLSKGLLITPTPSPRHHIRHTLRVNRIDVTTPSPSSPPGANLSVAPPICAPPLQATLTAIDTLITLPRKNYQWSRVFNALSREYSQTHIISAPPRIQNLNRRKTRDQTLFTLYFSHPPLQHHFFTLSGKQRFVALYAIVNSGALENFKDGIIHIPLLPLLTVHTIHPLIHLPLTLLVGATTKRNLAGTKPKRRLWTEAGIATIQQEQERNIERKYRPPSQLLSSVPFMIFMPIPNANLPQRTPLDFPRRHTKRTVRLTADLLCELVTISIERFRSQLQRNPLHSPLPSSHDLFYSYSARITLHAPRNSQQAGCIIVLLGQ
ncbi:uncharacterized protein EDB91DRAFT_1247469 [Suillus paluster]|uniref:uncharacterized protein n=1 Tax=Suillus paluster TaxID=48578 RepID=UPI001B85C4D3|nr:uncharacterized protein EDB91DRAFT_1247469 [Suillus paluster]KAG1742655.1 hypothetical protein EDB91DRAFT_1247469 [Suillus paluster]